MNIKVFVFALTIVPLYLTAMENNKAKKSDPKSAFEIVQQKVFDETRVQIGVDPVTFSPIYQRREQYVPRHPFGWRASDKDREEYRLQCLYKASL